MIYIDLCDRVMVVLIVLFLEFGISYRDMVVIVSWNLIIYFVVMFVVSCFGVWVICLLIELSYEDFVYFFMVFKLSFVFVDFEFLE